MQVNGQQTVEWMKDPQMVKDLKTWAPWRTTCEDKTLMVNNVQERSVARKGVDDKEAVIGREDARMGGAQYEYDEDLEKDKNKTLDEVPGDVIDADGGNDIENNELVEQKKDEEQLELDAKMEQQYERETNGHQETEHLEVNKNDGKELIEETLQIDVKEDTVVSRVTQMRGDEQSLLTDEQQNTIQTLEQQLKADTEQQDIIEELAQQLEAEKQQQDTMQEQEQQLEDSVVNTAMYNKQEGQLEEELLKVVQHNQPTEKEELVLDVQLQVEEQEKQINDMEIQDPEHRDKEKLKVEKEEVKLRIVSLQKETQDSVKQVEEPKESNPHNASSESHDEKDAQVGQDGNTATILEQGQSDEEDADKDTSNSDEEPTTEITAQDMQIPSPGEVGEDSDVETTPDYLKYNITVTKDNSEDSVGKEKVDSSKIHSDEILSEQERISKYGTQTYAQHAFVKLKDNEETVVKLRMDDNTMTDKTFADQAPPKHLKIVINVRGKESDYVASLDESAKSKN